jgi:glycosyltransferase involved in cell wall biosynthesis
MRILICAQQAPLPPANGFRLQVAALLRELRREHEVRVVALRFPDQERIDRDRDGMRLLSVPRSIQALFVAGRVVAPGRGHVFAFQRLADCLSIPLDDELRRFRPDVVHVAGVALATLGRRLAPHAAVLAPLDAAHLNVEARALRATGMRRRFLDAEVACVQRFEADEYGHFRSVVVVSTADAAALTAVAPSLRPVVIPNGVDMAAFAPHATSVMPHVRAAVPSAHLAIVGRRPARAVRRLGRLPGIEVVGEVRDMRAWLTTSRVCVCPMISGTGIKNKLLEAMACGVPCVVTPRALRGLHAVPGAHVLLGETPAELGSQIARLLRDDDTARTIGAAGRAYVVAEHAWRDVAAAYVRLYESVLATPSDGYRSMSQVCSERPPSTGMRAPVT